MAHGFILSPPMRTAAATTMNRFSPSLQNYKFPIFLSSLHYRNGYNARFPPRRLFCCTCSLVQESVNLDKYKEAFSERMTMAGLKPHHRIALGVSGGPDSMALCLLTAAWKTDGFDAVGESDSCIDGLLAIIVDHGLRAESKEEAKYVSHRVSQMGIRCEIAHCSWSDGRPKQGHIQEAAREMRYQIFQDLCTQHQFDVLLTAHHADDQAELFVIRLSRNSGVLGLAGMAFTSQVFSLNPPLYGEGLRNEGILLVRPLLHFSKADMYKICQGGHQDWVEDPTNRSPLYARNRIRMSLGNLSSYIFQAELQAVISACRKTRAYVDQLCHNLINQAVIVMDQQGYAIIDLESLDPSKVMDICLSKFISLVLQFISQRHRPVRGSALKLLLEYIRAFPCKTSLTASGCYLCPAPGSRGTKMLICCSVNCPLPSNMELIRPISDGERKQCISSERGQIIAHGKLYADRFVPDDSEVFFLKGTSESVLTEAKKLNIISESTYKSILSLQREETRHFKDKNEVNFDNETENEVESIIEPSRKQLQPGKLYYFMNRFLVSWKLSNAVHERACINLDFGEESQHQNFQCCRTGHDMVAEIRHMIESDWLYLAKLSKGPSLVDLQQKNLSIAKKMEQTVEERSICLDYLRLSAERALMLLKSIPVAARRSLPVLINSEGQLLSIPSIRFNSCPCLTVSCVFKPRVPLGGGHSSFV